MKKIVVGWLLIFGLFSIVSAQSGRKVAPPLLPTPSPELRTSEETEGFSESKPAQNRRINPPLPNLRGGGGNNSKNEPKQQIPNAPQTNEVLNDSEDEIVKVETNLITIPVSVFDRNGLYIPNLTEENFKIFENGKEQEIAYFATSEKPFTVVLLIDTSPSTQFKIDEIQDAAIAFVNQLKPHDSVIVIEFDADVDVLTEATTDRQKIHKAIRRADFGDGTSLYHAVDFSLRKRLNKIQGRKAIVLFTDGVDTTSYKADYESTIRDAEEADTLIFPIYYNTYLDNQGGIINTPFPFPGTGGGVYGGGSSRSDYALGKRYLDELAASTGGRVFQAGSTGIGLSRAFEGIAEELRRQYSIGYYPTDVGQAGQRKQIKVRVNRPNLIVKARDSYLVGDKNTKQQTTDTSKSK
jgi:Ca-activated chloride channel homolog